ncbi:oxygen-independent coproporphyrinogen III oxidase [Modicisalibacter xianhensis]|uniref:Coproporphyrinogen-III oxidase n=1 Tax=Modicisalibacter xianhensis TaxID=442341 RepID=A0A1I3DLI6_9GAMM|nr:oxygen-independent coproporphyrinogen III oxidase [Halomonas xianhensis]SFH87622.1 oxygen-independent coproporphyrinogen-3 oxidase [Halomonas xianhensis]
MDRFTPSDLALLATYDQPAPRYATYPRPARFDEGVSVRDYRQAARASNEDPIPKPLAVHVPFCLRRSYCRDDKDTAPRAQRADQYLSYLTREIALHAALYDRDRQVEQLSLGGGMPALFSDAQLADLLGAVHRHFGLRRGRAHDFALQVGPNGVALKRIATLAQLGFNRLSVVVHDLDPPVQRAMGHRQDAATLAGLFTAARRAHIPTLGVVLSLGLPGQTLAGLSTTLTTLLALRPERIDLSRYSHRPGLPGDRQRGAGVVLPTREQRLAMLDMAVSHLEASGYVRVGMAQFVRPDDALAVAYREGRLRHDVNGDTEQPDADLIGLGMAAISKVGEGYYQNARELPRYFARLDSGELPIWRGHELSADDRLRRDVIQRLLCQGEVDFSALEKRHRIVFRNYFAAELIALERFIRDGLVVLRRGSLALTRQGWLLANRVAMLFDRELSGLAPVRLQIVR